MVWPYVYLLQNAVGNAMVCKVDKVNRVHSFSLHGPPTLSAANPDAAFIPFWWVGYTSDEPKANKKKTDKVHDGIGMPAYVNESEIRAGEHACLCRKKAEPTILNKEKPYAIEFVPAPEAAVGSTRPAKSARRK